MTLEDAVKFFGSGYKICKLLGIKKQAFTMWKKNNKIPPLQQYRLEVLSEFKLKADF